MQTADNPLRPLFRCSGCGHEIKLPWASDASWWCQPCGKMIMHTLVTNPPNPDSVEDRIHRFAERMQEMRRMAPQPAQQPPAPGEIAAKLKSAGYPSRAVEAIGRMRGHGLRLSDSIAGSGRRDAHWIVYGGNGTGKTCAAARVAGLRVSDRRSPGRYISVPDLREQLQTAMDKGQAQADITAPLKSCALLVVDEAQDCGSTDWLPGILRQLADARYREYRPTIWLANARTHEEMLGRLGSRIVDRASETGGIINCGWESYRG